MSRLTGSVRPILFLLLGISLSGCDDQLPTFTGGSRFPDGAIPPTLERIFTADEFVLEARSVTGPTSEGDLDLQIVAQNFDGLHAHVLATFAFPDTIEVNGAPNEVFEYTDSNRVVLTIPDTLATSATFLTFGLYAIGQPWDTASVSWQYAVDRPGEQIAWGTPGGVTAELIGIRAWSQTAEGAEGDSIVWSGIPASVFSRMAAGETHGLLVRLMDNNSAGIISNLTLETGLIAESHPDTVVLRTLRNRYQTVILDQEPERPAGVLRVGGATSDRSLLRFDLTNLLPGCPTTGPSCADLAPGEVSLNRVELLLDPQPVTRGYRPLAPLRVSAWRTVEPQLGDRALLASIIDIRLFPAANFAPGATEPVMLDMTSAVAAALGRGDAEIGVALLVEPEASTFAFGWFDVTPRLRFVYTTPPTPQLP